jgi:hypothetical protein
VPQVYFSKYKKNVKEMPLPEDFSPMTRKIFLPNGISLAKLARVGETGGCVAP